MRSFWVFVAVLLAAGVAFAADLATEVTELDAAIAVRIAAIGTAVPRSPDAVEAARLASARLQLARYRAANDIADFKALAAAGKLIHASRTVDPSVVAESTQVIDAMCALVAAMDGLAEDAKALLSDPANAALVEAGLVKAREVLGEGKDLLATDPLRAQALVLKARKSFAKAYAKALKLQLREAGPPPPVGIGIQSGELGLYLTNASTHVYDVVSIRLFVQVDGGAGPIATYTGESAKSVIPDLFSTPFENRIYGALGNAAYYFDLTSILLRLVPDGATAPRITGRVEVTLRNRAPFNAPVGLAFP